MVGRIPLTTRQEDKGPRSQRHPYPGCLWRLSPRCCWAASVTSPRSRRRKESIYWNITNHPVDYFVVGEDKRPHAICKQHKTL